MKQRNIAIIPARGGSKRVPLKNIRTLGGKPIIAYTISAAIESGLFDRIVVSTDHEEIADIARDCGAEVPFLRDACLSDDMTPVSSVTVDALHRLDPACSEFDNVAQLMPNCPLRTASDVCSSYKKFDETGSASQISVVRYGWLNPWWAMRMNEQNALAPMFEQQIAMRSQDLPELFCPTGAIWWAQARSLRESKTFHSANKTGWEMPWQRGIDIDTYEDWTMAEILVVSR